MSASTSPDYSKLECRPYWQWLVLGGGLGLAGYVGGRVAGQQWPSSGDSALLLALIVVTLCAVFRLLRMERVVAPLLLESADGPEYSASERLLWPMGGFLGVLIALLLLEKTYPYYFTQDDNLAVNLPSILEAYRSLFSGVFPTWNPHQYMGSPNTSLGYYALTYPFTLVSYWLARTALHNENATLEVFAFVHLLLGYCALYWAIRREGCRPSIAMLASSCCNISGYALIFSRTWFQFSPILLWTSLMVVCVQELVRGKVGWKWIAAFGATIGISAHVGFTQIWVYSVMLIDVVIVLLMFTGIVRVRLLIPCLAAHFVGLAIAAPILIPQMLATYNVTRYPENTGIVSGLKGLFIPDSLSSSPHPMGWGKGYPIGEMYYSGTLFMVVAAILLLSLLAMRWGKRTAGRNVWFLCALLAFVLALGNRGLLWTGMTYLPGFNRFRFPFKFLGYIVLFSVVGGAVALERLMRNKRWSEQIEVPLAIFTWAVLAYHCTLCTAAFSIYNFQPFPGPDQDIARRLVPEGDLYYPKVLPIRFSGGQTAEAFPYGGVRSPDPHFVDSFMNEWATVYGAFNLSGYDPLVSVSPTVLRMVQHIDRDPERALFEYGVKYVLQYDPPDPERSRPRTMLTLRNSTLVYQSDTVFLSELPLARPMAFSENQPETPLPVMFDGAGATITTSVIPQGGRVVLNMLWRQEIQSHANGSKISATADDWGRIALNVPAGTKEVRVTFSPPWAYGFAVAGVALFFALALGWWSLRSPAKVTVLESEPGDVAQ